VCIGGWDGWDFRMKFMWKASKYIHIGGGVQMDHVFIVQLLFII